MLLNARSDTIAKSESKLRTCRQSPAPELPQATRAQPSIRQAPCRSRAKAAHASQDEVVTDPESLYFVAMNNFKVVPEMGEAFEERWTSRESHLQDTPGFKSFALLKCDTPGEYVSFSRWQSRQHFEAWTQSQSVSPLAMTTRAASQDGWTSS
ncbi:hypothetical protein WJX74_001884 [Apatococcus lobatus]|uniref:ABM domain-containing protein n=2 Tax=Apatococcus TaxID=904362 RepID=A0AAW1TEN2_9CHLO